MLVIIRSVILAEKAATAAGISTPQFILALLGTAGVASIFGAIVTGLFNRRKLGSEATEIITKAASGVVERIEEDNARLRNELAIERTARQALERDMERFRRLAVQHSHVLQMHAAWDMMAVSKLEEYGITDLPKPPPPLYGPDLTPSRVKEGTLGDDLGS